LNFKTVESVDQVVWDMKMADWPRATNRASINQLFNGNPPFTEQEQVQNNIYSNYNDLTGTRIASAARGQFLNALVTPDPLVNIELDYGPAWKRREWASRISNAINRNLKNSLPWMEEEESTFAQTVLHGIGPAYWPTQELWCPRAKGIEDVLVPGNTLRDFTNLQFFAVYEQYTAAELYRLTSGPKVDKGWNMELVKYLIDWQISQAKGLMANAWPQTWSPERNVEMLKEDAGIVGFDTLPTIDTWHFYFWSDDGKNSGWRKRVILDSWGNPGQAYSGMGARPDKKKYGDTSKIKSQFLFNPGPRKYANQREELISFQFGDASAVAPFRYHACRGLGFMLYAVCQIENRLKCKLTDSAFEACMQYFRVSDPADQERLTKLDLINFGVIPEGVNFMPQEQRWQTNLPVIENTLQRLHNSISENSASFTQDFDLSDDSKEETATRTMAKVNSTAQLVNSMIGRAYNYQKYKLQEVSRRHCIKDSRDPDVRRFRVEMLKADVPVEALNIERWTVQPVRVIGNGNKMIQVAMMDKVMATAYPRVGAEAQNDLMRLFIAVNTGDYDLAKQLFTQYNSMPSRIPFTTANWLLAGCYKAVKCPCVMARTTTRLSPRCSRRWAIKSPLSSPRPRYPTRCSLQAWAISPLILSNRFRCCPKTQRPNRK